MAVRYKSKLFLYGKVTKQNVTVSGFVVTSLHVPVYITPRRFAHCGLALCGAVLTRDIPVPYTCYIYYKGQSSI